MRRDARTTERRTAIEDPDEVKNDFGLPQRYVGLPGETLLLGDAVYFDIEPINTFWNQNNTSPIDHALIYRHSQGESASLVYFDGHAEQVSRPIPTNGFDSPPGGLPPDGEMPVAPPW